MCGRFGYTLVTLKDGTQKWVRLVQEWDGFDFSELENTFKDLSKTEIHPGAKAPIIINQNTIPKFVPAIWGIQPEWSPKLIFNTRTEKLFSSKFWSLPSKFNRCIVPASHFYEWKSEKGTKVKYKISPMSGDWFCFAGIWGIGESSKEKNIWFSILTQEGNSLMKEIHNTGGNLGRQPVHLSEDKWNDWLNSEVNSEEQILSLVESYESNFLRAVPVDAEPTLF